PSLSERVHADRLPQVAQLAMLPVALQAGEDVELCRSDRASISRALEVWNICSPLAPREEARLLSRSERATSRNATEGVPYRDEMADTLGQWWETYLESRPGWPVALAALDQMILGEGDEASCR